MTDTEEVKSILSEQQPFLASHYGVSKIGLFGSYASGKPSESSDVDLFIEFERPIGFKFIELADYLEQLLGREVDILTQAGIDGIRIPAVAQDIEETILYV